jgi:voltage-gated potassium channel
MFRPTIAEREAWLGKLERWTELPLLFLALLLIPVLIAPDLISAAMRHHELAERLNYLIWGVFAANLTIKTAIAPHRIPYLKQHWYDVAIVVLPMLHPLRVAAPLVRGLWALRAMAAAVYVVREGRKVFTRHQLHYILLTSLIVIVLAGSLVTIAERNAERPSIRSLPDGLWWAVTTVSTVGYGDTYPTTNIGRGVGVALMILGIALFGAITANLASLFVERQDDKVVREIQGLREEMAQLRQSNEQLIAAWSPNGTQQSPLETASAMEGQAPPSRHTRDYSDPNG